MGGKFPIDTRFQQIPEPVSIYNHDNPYGYRINVNHPKILPLYEAYHKKIGAPLHIHLSRAQRLAFERIIFQMIGQQKMKRREQDVQPSDFDGQADP